MKQYNNILAVIEPKRSRQLALRRALEIARYNPKVTICALRLVYDYSYDLHILNRIKEKSAREDILETNQEQLKESLKPYLKDTEVKVIPKAVFAKDIGVGIITELQEGGHDLLIKAANHHKVLDSIIFTPIDWYLLRNAEVPVIIAKEHKWEEAGNIIIVLDFTFREHRATNLILLREAQMISAITGGKIHLVTCVPVVLPTVMLEVPHYAPEIYTESLLADNRKHLLEFASQHGIPEEQCHIGEGMYDDVIPGICNKLSARAVLIGSAGRSGPMAAFVGNACEEIVDYINADLIVLNHKLVRKEKPGLSEKL